jgi:3-oxoacyl-[acyl-carrier-protein] synthase III
MPTATTSDVSESIARNSVIESMGVYLPPKKVTTKEILRSCRNSVLYPLERLTGIRIRHMAGDTEFSIDLGRKAITECLRNSEYEAKDIDLLICCNISRVDGPNFHLSFEPSTSVRLKKQLGFDNALVFDISNACAGMFTAVNVVDGFLKAGLARRAMVVSGEYITHLTKTAQQEIENKGDSRVPCLTLGDSGVAVILEQAKDDQVGFHDIDMFTLGNYSDYCIAGPTTSEYGGAIMITESIKLHAVAIKESVRHMVGVLRRSRWSWQDIRHLIMHQTARSAIFETCKQINEFLTTEVLDRSKMINNLEERGNTSTTTHFVALWDQIHKNVVNSNDKILFAVQASGITIGTAAYTLDDLPTRLRAKAAEAAESVGAAVIEAPVIIKPAPALAKADGARVRIESIGSIPDDAVLTRDAVEMVRIAGENCLDRSSYGREEIDLLIHAGVHRNDFLVEPAIAAMIAGRLGINDVQGASDRRTFAFDVFNGSIGFLNACHAAVSMIKSQKFHTAMVVASEIENNAEAMPEHLLGIRETGSAMIVDEDRQGLSGFGEFHFDYHTHYIDAYSSHVKQDAGRNFLSFVKDPQIESYYLETIPRVVGDLLRRENLKLSQIKAIFPPQISGEFIDRISERLNIVRDRFIDIAQDGKDLFTSSIAYAFGAARDEQRVEPGDVGLVISVGAGIQVGCATYYF